MSLPSGYKRLEYIQSSGTQYVDSGFIPNGETTVEVAFESAVIASAISGNYPVYGASANYDSNAFELWSLGKGFCIYGSQAYKSGFGLSANVKYISKQAKNVLEINNQTLNFTKQTFSAPYNLLIFATHRNSGITISCSDAKLKIYFLKIYDNGTLVRDFIPCQKQDGTVGLWDDVNSAFYGNAGTGTFTAGPEVKGTNKALIDGTGYDINAGKCLVGGTAYALKKGRTLVNGTAYEISFKPSEYTITMTGSGGKITYNGVEQTKTFIVAAGESITITATAFNENGKFPERAIIQLNGTTVSSKTAFEVYETVTATYTYTPEQDTRIIRSTTDPGTGRFYSYSTTIKIETT